uniref:Uncharacterized protein n=1 Tax=Oryzias latipes TaxID=8090 RepID=A0A3B3IK82_ORYLA
MSSSVVPFKNQRYADQKRDCIKRKRLFRDPEFPADDSSLFYEEPPPGPLADCSISGDHSAEMQLLHRF